MRDNNTNFLLSDDCLALNQNLSKEFPQLIELSSIGKTFEDRDI